MATKQEKAAAAALAIAMKELGAIAAATVAGSFVFTSKAIHLPLVAAGLVVVNETDVAVNEAGESATKATEAGIAAANTPAPAANAEPAPKLVITLEDNITMPEVVAKAGGGVGRESIYPFKTMNVNQSFFVPASEKMPKPWESLASAVANAEKKFATVKTIPLTNEDGSPMLDGEGKQQLKKVMKTVKSREKGKEGQEVQKPELVKTRTFKVFKVTENEVDGARIWRTA